MANSIWRQPGLNQSHFVALTNLLSLRNNGQIEPSIKYEDLEPQDETFDDDDCDSVDTSVGQQLSSSGNDRLKRQFLDDIAEFAAKEHGALFVACTAMVEREEDVEIIITRNTPFQSSDIEFFAKFSDLVSSWSSHQHNPPAADSSSWIGRWETYFWSMLSAKTSLSPLSVEDIVWNNMLKYYATRIKLTYLPKLKRSFRACPSINISSENSHMEDSRVKINNLSQLVFSFNDKNLDVDNLHTLVMEAYQLLMSKPAKAILMDTKLATNETKKLWESIYFLGRLQTAFKRLYKVILMFPSFQKVKFVPLPPSNIIAQISNDPLGLEKTLQLLGLDMSVSTVKDLLGRSWTVKGARKKFMEIQCQQLHIHAEVKILLHLCSTSHAGDNTVYNYIGCSKRSCFMCWNLLRMHGKFSTRGCHGRLFSRWTVPECTYLTANQSEVLGVALLRVRDSLVDKLISDHQYSGRLEKTSVVGGSSLVSDELIAKENKTPGLSQRENEMTQRRIAFSFERDERERLQNTRLTRSSLSRWPVAGSGTYLNTLHRPFTPADYLYQDCWDDRMPDDPDVLDNFGFQKLISYNDLNKLLGLYQGLVKYLGVTAEDLNTWQQENSLTANIIRVYSTQSLYSMGAYFPWFLQNTHILNDQQRLTDDKEYMRIIEKAKTFLEPEDQKKNWGDLQPISKQYSFEMLLLSLLGSSPNPLQETWLKFGFCACINDSEESKLGVIYLILLTDHPQETLVPQHLRSKPCTFGEFLHAYESGGLVKLMKDKIKNQGVDIEKLPLVMEYLSHPPSDIGISVWNLKQFLEINQYAAYPPPEPVRFDYGFLNCQGFEEVCILAEIYKRLLRVASPLEVHKACLENRLFELADRYHKMDGNHRRLMNNSYSEEVMLEGLTNRKFLVEDGSDQRQISFAEFRELMSTGGCASLELRN